MSWNVRRILTVAGSDSSGGAGLQADLKTFAALECYGMTAVTAVTVQNTQGVSAIHAVPPAVVRQQMEAVLTDMGADAVKIGMLHDSAIVQAVADVLKKHRPPNIVLDPVISSQSGQRLLQDDAVQILKRRLIPLAHLITPNLPEAELLLGHGITSDEEIEKAARDIASLGCPNVLIKGGHGKGNTCTDRLFIGAENRIRSYSAERIDTRNNHGTGCTLASAIAALLAKGSPLPRAVEKAKHYLTGTLSGGTRFSMGSGSGPVHHFHHFWKSE